jgi:hypothetical protein
MIILPAYIQAGCFFSNQSSSILTELFVLVFINYFVQKTVHFHLCRL